MACRRESNRTENDPCEISPFTSLTRRRIFSPLFPSSIVNLLWTIGHPFIQILEKITADEKGDKSPAAQAEYHLLFFFPVSAAICKTDLSDERLHKQIKNYGFRFKV